MKPAQLVAFLAGWAVFVLSSGWLGPIGIKGPLIYSVETATAWMALHLVIFSAIMYRTRTTAFDVHEYSYVELPEGLTERRARAKDIARFLSENGGIVIYLTKDKARLRKNTASKQRK